MKIEYGKGTTQYGPGVSIELSDDEVAIAIDAWLAGQRVHVNGPRTITVNGELCREGQIYVDPSGFAVADGKRWSGRGPSHEEDDPDEAAEEAHKKSYSSGYRDGWRDGRHPLNNPPAALSAPDSKEQP